jgi:hypothetical protein
MEEEKGITCPPGICGLIMEPGRIDCARACDGLHASKKAISGIDKWRMMFSMAHSPMKWKTGAFRV